jgi:hypothetical protein
MKNIKIVLNILFVLSIFSFSAIAQPKNGGAKMEKKMNMLTEKLDLTENQQLQLKAIFKKGSEKIHLIKSQEGDRNSKKKAFKAHQEVQAKEIKAVLNKKQLILFEKMLDERTAKMQKGHANRKMRKESFKNVDKKALRTEMKAYKEKNILPVLMTQRQKLESQISTNDKKTIEEIRSSFKQLRQEYKALKGNRKKKEEYSDADKKAFEALKSRKKEDMAEAQVLLERYKSQIKTLKEEINPQIEQWKTDLKAIAQKHGVKPHQRDMKEGEGKSEAKKHGKRKHRKGKKGKHHSKRQSFRKQLSPLHFLLMDVDAQSKVSSEEATSASSMRVYPNPAQGQNTIEFKLATAGKISLELHDTEGNLVRIIANGYKEAGDYKEEINLSDLKNYVYFYILKDATGMVLTKKFVIKR